MRDYSVYCLTGILCFAMVSSLAACGGGSGEGRSSGVDSGGCVLPSAPGGISAGAGNVHVTVSWDPVSDAASYNIYWSVTSAVTRATGTKIPNATSPYIQTGLINGTTYYYVVTAVDQCGESNESEQVSATPSALPSPPALPPPPT